MAEAIKTGRPYQTILDPPPADPRYERALVYQELGWGKRARSELEKLYAEAPDYEDMAARLGS